MHAKMDNLIMINSRFGSDNKIKEFKATLPGWADEFRQFDQSGKLSGDSHPTVGYFQCLVCNFSAIDLRSSTFGLILNMIG